MSRPLALKKREYLAKEDVSGEERMAAEAMQRSFERSLAGPSVGKAGKLYQKHANGTYSLTSPKGITRDQTGS